jgi:hypothetical protein
MAISVGSAPNSLIYVTDCRPVTQLKLSLILVVPSSPARHQQATESLFCLMMPPCRAHTPKIKEPGRGQNTTDCMCFVAAVYIFLRRCSLAPDAICGPIKIIVSADRERALFCFAWQQREHTTQMRDQLTLDPSSRLLFWVRANRQCRSLAFDVCVCELKKFQVILFGDGQWVTFTGGSCQS